MCQIKYFTPIYTPGSDWACSYWRGSARFPERWQPFWVALICEHSEKYHCWFQKFTFPEQTKIISHYTYKPVPKILSSEIVFTESNCFVTVQRFIATNQLYMCLVSSADPTGNSVSEHHVNSHKCEVDSINVNISCQRYLNASLFIVLLRRCDTPS